jgi:hypothetical protein
MKREGGDNACSSAHVHWQLTRVATLSIASVLCCGFGLRLNSPDCPGPSMGGDRIPPSLESARPTSSASCPKFRKNTNGVAAAAALPLAICGPGGDVKRHGGKALCGCSEFHSYSKVPPFYLSSHDLSSYQTLGVASFLHLAPPLLPILHASHRKIKNPPMYATSHPFAPLPQILIVYPDPEFQRLYTSSAFRAERILWRAIIQRNILRSAAPSWTPSSPLNASPPPPPPGLPPLLPLNEDEPLLRVLTAPRSVLQAWNSTETRTGRPVGVGTTG